MKTLEEHDHFDRSNTTANKGFAIAGVSCFADTFVQGGSSVLRMGLVLINPAIVNLKKR